MLLRATIRRLRSGVVPAWELERLSVGYGKIKEVVHEAFDGLLGGAGPQPLFVRGEWGSGKSHFLSFVRASAKARGFPSARVDLNARSAALNYPQRFLTTVAESLGTAEYQGLREILLGTLFDASQRARLAAFAASSKSGDLQWPLLNLCQRCEHGDQFELMEDPAWTVLYGADLSWADYTYKRAQATARIGAIGRMFEAIGQDGLVVVFDEAETIDQLWNVRSRMSAYGVLGQLCRLEKVWCVFGITERFDRTVEGDLERGALEYDFTTESAGWFLRAWQRGQFAVLEPPPIDSRSARRLANSVVRLYEAAYEHANVEARVVDRCVDEWLRNPSRNPRKLIRVLIHRLDANCRLKA